MQIWRFDFFDFGGVFLSDFSDFRENFEIFCLLFMQFAIVLMHSEVCVDIAVFDVDIAVTSCIVKSS
jgi:hypothetical protein